MKKRLLALCLALAMALCLAACGGEDAEVDRQPPSKEPDAPTANPEGDGSWAVYW